MSRRTFRFVLAALAITGGLSLATPSAEAAERTVREPDVWSRALSWVAHLWEEKVVGAWEMEGWGADPNGSPQATPPPGAPAGGDPNS